MALFCRIDSSLSSLTSLKLQHNFVFIHCRAFLVAVLNDARQKIVETKFPVKKRVIMENNYFKLCVGLSPFHDGRQVQKSSLRLFSLK